MTVKELQKLLDRKIQKTYEDEEIFKSSYPNANDYYEGRGGSGRKGAGDRPFGG